MEKKRGMFKKKKAFHKSIMLLQMYIFDATPLKNFQAFDLKLNVWFSVIRINPPHVNPAEVLCCLNVEDWVEICSINPILKQFVKPRLL